LRAARPPSLAAVKIKESSNSNCVNECGMEKKEFLWKWKEYRIRKGCFQAITVRDAKGRNTSNIKNRHGGKESAILKERRNECLILSPSIHKFDNEFIYSGLSAE
jgi:hypothetical protein